MNPKTNLFRRIFMCVGLILMLMYGWTAAAQEKAHVVKGKILDEENLPLVGVGVVVVGTLNGVISDENGNYFELSFLGEDGISPLTDVVVEK